MWDDYEAAEWESTAADSERIHKKLLADAEKWANENEGANYGPKRELHRQSAGIIRRLIKAMLDAKADCK
jgi:hypothetical protein